MSDAAVESRLAKVTAQDVGFTEDGVKLSNLAEAFRFSEWVVQAGMAPKGMSAQSVVVAMQIGAEIGLKPMESLQSITVFNGQGRIRGHLALAMIAESGVCIELPEMGCDERHGELVGFCRSHRKGWGGPRVTTFSMADAKRAGITEDKKSKHGGVVPSMYKKYPQRMLQWRAVGHHATDYYSDVLRGHRISEDAAVEDRHSREVVRTIQPVGLDPLLEEPANAPQDDAQDAQIVAPVTEDPAASETCGVCDTDVDVVEGACPIHTPEPEQETML